MWIARQRVKQWENRSAHEMSLLKQDLPDFVWAG